MTLIFIALFTLAIKTLEINGFFKAVSTVAEEERLVKGGNRILANHGVNAGQEVPHFHIHIFGKQKLGSMISKN